MIDKPKPYPKNVEGDFYVEDGCCLACMIPEEVAPNLISFDDETSHCFFSRQPVDKNEIYEAIKAVSTSDVGCIRYGGDNFDILRRLAEAGVSESCDHRHLVWEIKPLLRSHVIFDDSQIKSEMALALHFKEYLTSRNTTRHEHKIIAHKLSTKLYLSWYESDFYPIWFSKAATAHVWHVFHAPEGEKIDSRYISGVIEEWLMSRESVSNIKWYSNRAWNESLPEWQETTI